MKDETRPPLSWGAILFLEAPSSRVLNFVIGSVFISIIGSLVAGYFIEMDLTIQAAGEVVSDIGTRDAVALTSGLLATFDKKIDDEVNQDEVIGTLAMDQTDASEVEKLRANLARLAVQISTPTLIKASPLPSRFTLLIDKISNQDVVPSLIDIDRTWLDYESKQQSVGVTLSTEAISDVKRKASLDKKLAFLRASKNRRLLSFQIESFEQERDQIQARLNTLKNQVINRREDSRERFLRAVQIGQTKLRKYLALFQIRAPVSGRIAKLLTGPNAYVSEGKALAVILPTRSSLVALLRVPDKFLAKVVKGQTTLFRLEAYPYQKYGVFTGTVVSTEIPKSVDGASVDSYFLIKSQIQAPARGARRLASDDTQRIMIGMKFDASIILGRKKIYQIVIQKLLSESHD